MHYASSAVRPASARTLVAILSLLLGALLRPAPVEAQALPPVITKAFGTNTIPLNGQTTLTFTYQNPNTGTSLTGVGFTDTLPTGLEVSTPAGLSGNCAGGTITAVSGTGVISLSGATLAPSPVPGSTCSFTVNNVVGTTVGVKNNSVTVASAEGGVGNTGTASLTVLAPLPPVITKAFGTNTIPLNGQTTLTFTYQNPNTGTSLTGVGFTDTLPTGLEVSTPAGLSGNCAGGTITAVSGTGVISLSGATLAPSPVPGSTCSFTVNNVVGTTVGVKNNSVTVASAEGGVGNISTASLTVTGAPPVITKVFGAAQIALNGTTSLTFTITNPNAVLLTGLAFTDPLPAGLVVSTPNGLTGSCDGGAITATQDTNVISLSGASLAASSSCNFAINVTGIAAGPQNNTTGNVTSTNAGTGNTASASLVVAPVVIAPAIIPTLQQWELWLLALLILVVGAAVIAGRRARDQS